jgi:serine/threonine-protein kinase
MVDRGAIGSVLDDRYEVMERLGEGLHFAVFKAKDRVQNRTVVVKLLKPDVRPNDLDAWREALSVPSKLSHPSMAQVYEVGRVDGTIYLVSEYVRGINLKERIRRTAPFSLAVAVDIAIAVAEALEYAHKQGVIHSDVRPHNVLINAEGEVKVTDFGVGAVLARSPDSEPLLRTVHYVPPEVAEGSAPSVASDMYSLGVILYEMLTGVVPFDAETPLAVLLRQAKEPAVPPGRINVGIPRAIDGIVLKCLQKDPTKRYRSMSSLLADLRAVQEALRFGRSLDWAPADVADAVAQEPDEEEPAAPTYLSAMSRAAMLVTGVALVAILVMFWQIFFRGTRDVQVPEVSGMERSQAEMRVAKLGLKPIFVEEWNDRVPAGTILRTYPSAGSTVKQGREITLWVSKGPQIVTVPDVTKRMDEATARRVIQESGLAVGAVDEQYSDDVPRGNVIEQDPPGNSRVAPGTQVALVISKGPEDVPVPDLVYDKTEREARNALERIGLTVGDVTRDYSDMVPAGNVLSQDPPAGTVVPVGSSVSLVVSRGPEPAFGEGGDTGWSGGIEGPQRRFRVEVRVPSGPDPQQIQIVVNDANGSRVVFDEPRSPGDRFVREVQAVGNDVDIQVTSDGKPFYHRVFHRPGG